MSTTKTLNDRAEEKKEFHKKRQELIESDEFKKMLVDYEHWSKHLP